MPAPVREYRDRLFTFIFGSELHRDWTLSLYNAVNETQHCDPDAITITTIRDVLYLGMHNDVSFLLADEMNLYEQQSTYNPNMPLRMLQYASNLYEKYTRQHRLNKHRRTLIALPAPRLVVFYNGSSDIADEVVLHLSDSFPAHAKSDIEVCVRMININQGNSPQLMETCTPLREYAWTVERIRDNMRNMEALRAIDDALEGMPKGFVIRPFLQAHKAEVRDMLLTEYDEAEAMELFREEGLKEGREEITRENLQSLMENLPCDLEEAMCLLKIPEAERNRYRNSP